MNCPTTQPAGRLDGQWPSIASERSQAASWSLRRVALCLGFYRHREARKTRRVESQLTAWLMNADLLRTVRVQLREHHSPYTITSSALVHRVTDASWERIDRVSLVTMMFISHLRLVTVEYRKTSTMGPQWKPHPASMNEISVPLLCSVLHLTFLLQRLKPLLVNKGTNFTTALSPF